jgi:hypothetical protein
MYCGLHFQFRRAHCHTHKSHKELKVKRLFLFEVILLYIPEHCNKPSVISLSPKFKHKTVSACNETQQCASHAFFDLIVAAG